MLVGFLLLLGGLFMMYWGYTQLNQSNTNATPSIAVGSPSSTVGGTA
jgi:hypothetical protein